MLEPDFHSDDLYKRLGLTKPSNEHEIKKAYRKLAVKWHPDKNSAANAEANFKQIGEAYAILSDPEKKRQYDTASSSKTYGHGYNAGGPTFDFGYDDFGHFHSNFTTSQAFNIFDHINEMFGDDLFGFGMRGMNPFSSSRGFGRRNRRSPPNSFSDPFFSDFGGGISSMMNMNSMMNNMMHSASSIPAGGYGTFSSSSTTVTQHIGPDGVPKTVTITTTTTPEGTKTVETHTDGTRVERFESVGGQSKQIKQISKPAADQTISCQSINNEPMRNHNTGYRTNSQPNTLSGSQSHNTQPQARNHQRSQYNQTDSRQYQSNPPSVSASQSHYTSQPASRHNRSSTTKRHPHYNYDTDGQPEQRLQSRPSNHGAHRSDRPDTGVSSQRSHHQSHRNPKLVVRPTTSSSHIFHAIPESTISQSRAGRNLFDIKQQMKHHPTASRQSYRSEWR